LNDLGLEQARLGAVRLAGEHWDAIISSPLSRAMQTAQAAAEAIGIDHIEPVYDLIERAYGDAEGLTIAEREERWPDGDWPGLETPTSTFERARNALAYILRHHAGQRVLVVSHGGLINAILHEISDGEVGTGVTRILNVSLTRIHSDDGEHWTVDVVSDADHLLDEHGVLNALTPGDVDRSGLASAHAGN
jgi:broad specificity phosphatase PhoE